MKRVEPVLPGQLEVAEKPDLSYDLPQDQVLGTILKVAFPPRFCAIAHMGMAAPGMILQQIAPIAPLFAYRYYSGPTLAERGIVRQRGGVGGQNFDAVPFLPILDFHKKPEYVKLMDMSQNSIEIAQDLPGVFR